MGELTFEGWTAELFGQHENGRTIHVLFFQNARKKREQSDPGKANLTAEEVLRDCRRTRLKPRGKIGLQTRRHQHKKQTKPHSIGARGRRGEAGTDLSVAGRHGVQESRGTSNAKWNGSRFRTGRMVSDRGI